MTTKDCFHCYYAQSNEDGLHCYRETRTKVKGTDTCEHYMTEKDFVDFGNDDFVLVDGKIFVKFARVFELIEDSDSLEGLKAICGADLNYIVATYLEQK